MVKILSSRKIIYLRVFCLMLPFFASCSKSPVQTGNGGFVSRKETAFIDSMGNEIIPYGLNVVNKNPKEGYIGSLSEKDFALIAGWGMNCIRLGIFWDAIEPAPGRIDQTYLGRVAALVEKAKKQGLWVLLDMHQDLYSSKFSDGAPAWATLDDGKFFQPEKVWSDAYYSSEAVQIALDHFWANLPAADGVGLQDHYALVWRAVAARFAQEPAVIGYDLMNEPFPGKDAPRIQEATLDRLAKEICQKKIDPSMTLEKMAELMKAEKGRGQILEWLRDLALFDSIMEAPRPLVQEFEQSRLQPMYARVAAKIREVDTRHLLLLEPCMAANAGVRSALKPLKDSRGRMDPQQAYAPHGYDLATDTDLFDKGSAERVALIFQHHHEKTHELQMPMLIGEWGAYYLNPQAAKAAHQVLSIFQGISCGSFYWSYSRELADSPLKAVFQQK
jgi:endoglycosylceramidase